MNCNNVPSTIIGQLPINDGKWHSIKWTRSNVNAQLFLDNTLVGSSEETECKINISPPFYFGGTNPTDYPRVIESIVRTANNNNNIYLYLFFLKP